MNEETITNERDEQVMRKRNIETTQIEGRKIKGTIDGLVFTCGKRSDFIKI